MSKKLIAVSAAFALALTGLVGIAPANATPATIVWTGAVGTGTSSDPYTRVVPETNAITSGTNAQVITVSNLLAGDTVTVSSVGTAKVSGDVIGTSTLIDVRNLGAATLTKTASGAGAQTLLFYVFSTSSAANSTITTTVTETDGGTRSTTTQTAQFKATTGAAHHVTNVVAPATLANGVSADVTFNVTDVFGNIIEANTPAAAVSGPTVASGGVATWDVTRKLNVARVTATTNNPFIITIDGNGATADPANAGLGASTLANNQVVNNAGVSAQVATLTAQVAALTTQLANSRSKDRSVTKKKYNTLARKWNAANPSARVALKK